METKRLKRFPLHPAGQLSQKREISFVAAIFKTNFSGISFRTGNDEVKSTSAF